ncbi:MAG TPA: glycosyltransferase [Candidatus Limnocylindrales bacterium]|nr:glycosyltransferase [Candidatus Limnocylindrales bacterium]
MAALTRRRPVAMLAHSYYEEDPRVRREAEALVASGRPVDVFALRRPGDPVTERLDGVQVIRLDVQRHQGAGLATYLAEYGAFFGRAGWALARAHRRRRYALVQVHSLPDALAFAALPVRLAGVPLLLDLHEAMPEFFRIRFPGAANRVAHALLVAQERASIAVATAVITVNESLADRLVGLGTPRDKVTVVRNSPALARFDPGAVPARSFMADGRLRLVYAGALSPIYELDVAIGAVAAVAAVRPDLDPSLELYGRDYGETDLAGVARDLGIADRVVLHGRVPIEAVPAAIAAADVGLAPTRRSDFTDYSLSTKLFEYAAMGKPVVATALPMVEQVFGPGTVRTYLPGDADDLARAVVGLADDPADREARVARTGALITNLSWEREAERYLALVERLAADGLSSPGSGTRPGDHEGAHP